MAIGRRLLSFFFPATSLAPQRKGVTDSGTFPADMTFTSLVKAAKDLLASAADVLFNKDLRCSGRIPEGPAPEPLGNERAAYDTSAEVKILGGALVAGGGG